MFSECSVRPECLIIFRFRVMDWYGELIRRGHVVISQSWNNRNTREHLVKLGEDKLGDVGDVIPIRRLGVSPVRSRVSCPDYKVRGFFMSHHGLEGRLDQQEGGVTGIVSSRADRLVVIIIRVMTEGGYVSPDLVLVVQVEVRDVPELAAITDQNREAQLEYKHEI